MKIRFVAAALIATSAFYASFFPSAGVAETLRPGILVVGGTPAGVAAAVAAARCGDTVELVARRPQLGGILTDAMLDQWDLNLARDGEPVQGGIFTEIYASLGDSFTPAQAASTFSDLVARESRIRVVTGAVPISVRTKAAGALQTVSGVTFRDLRGGTFAVDAPYVIDATDNGDVASAAKIPDVTSACSRSLSSSR